MKLMANLLDRTGLRRPRLLPVLVAAITLAAGMKVGAVWTDASIVLGFSRADAQAQTQNTSQQPRPTGGPRPLLPPGVSNVAPAQPAPQPKPSAPPQQPQALAQADAPAAAKAEASAKSAAATAPQPVPTQNSQPAPVPPQSVQRDPASFSKSEVEILQSLVQRREALETRARDLDFKEQLLAATAKQVDDKIGALKEIEQRIEELLKKRDEQEERNLRSLVKVYENMKAADAARIFEKLEMPILLDVVERMREAKVAPVLAQMNPTKAKTVTEELAARRSLPSRMPAKADGPAVPEKAGKAG